MAVQVNKRKRKHKDMEGNADEGDEVVPAKVLKENDTPLQIPQNGADSENINELEEDTEMQNPIHNLQQNSNATEQHGGDETHIKFSKDFKMLNFRSSLKTNNFITELRHFIYLADTKQKIISKFLEKRGKPLELVEAFELLDKTNVLHISYLCKALQMVLMEIISNETQHMQSALQACRFFLKSYGTVLDPLLKSVQYDHRCIALKLMTAVVCVEPQLGKQILSSYDILSDAKAIEQNLSHSKHQIDKEETVRKCYIHFVLAFLVDGNPLLVRNIIDRGLLIKGLIKGLVYDDEVTVSVVLSTLRQRVLESTDISKTKKVHVFDLECCKSLTNLYDWKGPKFYAAVKNEKNAELSTAEQFSKLIDSKSLETISKMAHEFLLLLLTSRKQGIAFDAISRYRQKHNVTQGKLINTLHHPWRHPLKTELVMKIIYTCPELARNAMRHFNHYLSGSKLNFHQRIEFLKFIKAFVSIMKPEIFQNALLQMTLTDISYWMKDTLLPMDILLVLRDIKTAKVQDYNFRVAVAELLLAMFNQYSSYIQFITRREQAKSDNSLRRFKFDLLSHLLLYFPTVENILLSLRFTIRSNEIHIDKVHHHLDIIFDLLLVMFKENRSYIDKTNTILDFLMLLRPLYTDDIAKPNGSNHNIKLEMKAVKTMLLIFPHVLEPQEELFPSVILSFTRAFVYGTEEVSAQAGSLLRGIFKNTGIFESCEMEIDLWLEPLRFFDPSTVEIVTKVFIEVLQVTKATVSMPDAGEVFANKESLSKLFSNIEKGLSVQGYLETISLSKLILLIFKGVEIVGPLKNYLEIVLLLMFHYYPTPSYVKNIYEMQLSSLKPYMTSWLTNSKTIENLQGAIPQTVPFLIEVQQAVLTGEQNFADIFTNKSLEKSFSVQLNGELVKVDVLLKKERLVMIYIQNVFFIISQLTEKRLLQRDQAERAANLLNKFFSLLKYRQTETVEENPQAEQEDFLANVLNYIFVLRLSLVRTDDLLSGASPAHLNYLLFLRLLIENSCNYEQIEDLTHNYRLKMVKSVEIALQDVEKTKSYNDQLEDGIKLFKLFPLSGENCVEILNLLVTNLSYEDFFIKVNGDYKPSIFYDLLCIVLQRLGTLKHCVDCSDAIRKISCIYINIHQNLSPELNLEKFEEGFSSFLNVSHQHICLLDSKFFCCFFLEKKITKASVKLACLLLERNKELNGELVKFLPEHFTKRELVYPLLNVAFRSGVILENSLIQSIYQEYKNGIMKTIEKPQKAGVIYKENVDCSIALVQHCMPNSECLDFTNKTFKFDGTEHFQIRIIQAIYLKAFKSLDSTSFKQRSIILMNFFSLMIQLVGIDVKKQNIDQSKIELIGYYLYSWITMYDNISEKALIFTKVLKSPQWMIFCKGCLKLAMHIDENEADVHKNDKKNGLLLKLLAFFFETIYEDYPLDDDDVGQEALDLFEMIFTHSKFFDIILNYQKTDVKTQLLGLLFTLAKKYPMVLEEKQIPIILGAYQGCLSDADRFALGLLHLYDLYDCNMYKYRPFIWGESAVAFYALRATSEEKLKLCRQDTTVAHIMALIDKQICDYTLENFPLWRKLNTLKQMPLIEFLDPDKKALEFGSNSLEKRVELGLNDFSESDRRFCPKKDDFYDNCYDPAFFVPLMSTCFSPEAFTHPVRPVQNGLLAVSFAALSCQDKEMRLAAANVQLRYRSHFEQSKFFEKPLWSQTYDNIQAGLSQLRNSWMKHKKNSGTPRVPFIPCLFLAKTFNISTDPTHILYKQLTMYLRLKSTFNFETIPEFNLLFFSPQMEHNEFRQFIVEIIKNGVKTNSDLFLLVATNTFRVLMAFYGATMSSLEMNLLILSLFSTCVKIPGSSKILLETVGILPWLTTIASSLQFYQFDVIEGLISIISNFWYALKASAEEVHNFAYVNMQMHSLLLQIAPHLSPRISLNHFSKFVNILDKTSTTAQYRAMSSTELDHIILCANKHFPNHTHVLSSLKQFGGSGALEHELYCKSLAEENLPMNSILALSSLRSYIIQWYTAVNNSTEYCPDNVY